MLQWSTIKVFMSQHSQQRFPDECFSLLISIRKPHEPVTPALIGRWVKKLNDKESIPQYPCSWWNDAVSFDSLRCSKLLLLLLVDLQSHLLNVQMSFFALFFTKKSANNKTKWATENLNLKILLTKKKTCQVLIKFHCHQAVYIFCQNVNFFMILLTIKSWITEHRLLAKKRCVIGKRTIIEMVSKLVMLRDS